MEYFVIIAFGVVFLLFIASVIRDGKRRRTLAEMTIVNAGVEYPNNHHVLGVGYYHAASQKWFLHAWNEYREGRGYFWEGEWHPTPDQRMVLKSTPPDSEVERVNQAWRNSDPLRVSGFWKTVEREGFGTAIRRSEGS